MPKTDIQDAFNRVRTQYFPEWSGEGWSAFWGLSPRNKDEDPDDSFGECIPETQEIWITRNRPDLDYTLVHEICHAVTGQEHGDKFYERMQKAATAATDAGEHDLAASIAEEIEQETPDRATTGLLLFEHATRMTRLGPGCASHLFDIAEDLVVRPPAKGTALSRIEQIRSRDADDHESE